MRHVRTFLTATAALCLLFAISVFTAGPTFRADYRFTGNSLTGFKPLGQATWAVQNGEIVGTPKDASGGWLLVDGKEFQDLQLYASVKCAAGCKAGYLLRAEKTADGGMVLNVDVPAGRFRRQVVAQNRFAKNGKRRCFTKRSAGIDFDLESPSADERRHADPCAAAVDWRDFPVCDGQRRRRLIEPSCSESKNRLPRRRRRSPDVGAAARHT